MAARVTWLRPTTQTPSSAVHKLTLVPSVSLLLRIGVSVQDDAYIPVKLESSCVWLRWHDPALRPREAVKTCVVGVSWQRSAGSDRRTVPAQARAIGFGN